MEDINTIERDKMRRTDHDLLIELNTNLKNLIVDFKEYKTFNNVLDTRLRNVEDVVTKLSPIPSVSHQDLVNNVTALQSAVATLQNEKSFVLGGWKGIFLLIGAVTGVVSFIGLLLQIMGYFR